MTKSLYDQIPPLTKAEIAWETAKATATSAVAEAAVFKNIMRVSNSRESKRQELKRLRAEHKKKFGEKSLDKPETKEDKGSDGSFKFGTGKSEHAWWDDMSHEQQKAYLTEHPNSQMAQELDKHITDKVTEKKSKGEKLTDKEEEIAQHHYAAKVRDSDDGSDEDDEDGDEETLKDVRPRKPKADAAPAPDSEPADDDTEVDEDADVLEDVTKKKKDAGVEKLIHGDKAKKILKSITDDPTSPLAKRIKAHLDAKDLEAEDLTKEEQALHDVLKKSAKKTKNSGYYGDDEDEDEKHAKTDKELADLFSEDLDHEERIAELEKDPSSKTADNVLDVLASKLSSGAGLSVKHKDLLRTIEKARRRSALSQAERDKEDEAEKKLAEAKNTEPTKKERGILKNIAKTMGKSVAKRIDDPTSAFYSFSKLRSGEDLTEVDKQNFRNAAMSVGKAMLVTAAIAGVACFAIGALPNLVTAWTEYLEKQGSGGTSVLSADTKDDPEAKEKLLAEYSNQFGEWLAEQNPKDFEPTTNKE